MSRFMRVGSNYLNLKLVTRITVEVNDDNWWDVKFYGLYPAPSENMWIIMGSGGSFIRDNEQYISHTVQFEKEAHEFVDKLNLHKD